MIDRFHRQAAIARMQASAPIDKLLGFTLLPAMLVMIVLVAGTVPLRSQQVELVHVDVAKVASGWRASKLLRSNVVNEANEKVGTLDDIVIAKDRDLFAVLQVGGFLGVGGRLVAVPYGSLVLDETGKIQLPGATREALRKLAEFQYPG